MLLRRVAPILAAGALVTPALADTIELRNGRRLEGKVTAKTSSSVRIVVEGGVVELPRSMVASITEGPTAEERLAEKIARSRMDDPSVVERLSEWAREHRLVEKARHLRELARGMRLDQRFHWARERATVAAYLEVAEWARTNGFSFEVRRLALAEARKLDPDSRLVQAQLQLLDREEEDARRAEEKRKAEKAAPPPPVEEPDPLAEREKALAEREKALAEREKALTEAPPQQPQTGWIILRRGGRRGPRPAPPPCEPPPCDRSKDAPRDPPIVRALPPMK